MPEVFFDYTQGLASEIPHRNCLKSVHSAVAAYMEWRRIHILVLVSIKLRVPVVPRYQMFITTWNCGSFYTSDTRERVVKVPLV